MKAKEKDCKSEYNKGPEVVVLVIRQRLHHIGGYSCYVKMYCFDQLFIA